MDLSFDINNWRAEYIERCTFGSEGGSQKPAVI